MASKADKTFKALGDLGYTGSIQDRQLQYLKDRSGLSKRSVADLQRALSTFVTSLLKADSIASVATNSFIKPWSDLQYIGLYSDPNVTVTDGRQISANNTGLVGAGIQETSLVSATSSTVTVDGTVVENKKFNGTLTINANNVVVKNCLFTNYGDSAMNIIVNGTGTTIQYCTIRPVAGNSAYEGVLNGGTNTTIKRCDISGCENNITTTGPGANILENYLHDVSKLSNPGGHRDVIEVYGGATVNILRNKLFMDDGETSVINCAPWANADSVSNMTVADNWIDGGIFHILVDLQSTGSITNTRILRNYMGGHTYPGYQLYWALGNNDSRTVVNTEAALQASPNAILFPTTGSDVNYWYQCTGLSPDLSGTIIQP